jgi:hypothetical protein
MPGRCRAGAFRLGECLYRGLRPRAATSALGDCRRDSIIYGSGDPCFISGVPDRRKQRWCINERWQVLDGRFVRLQIDVTWTTPVMPSKALVTCRTQAPHDIPAIAQTVVWTSDSSLSCCFMSS